MTRATRSAPWRRPSRLMVSVVTCAWPVQGGWNSGRKVISTRTGSCWMRSITRPRSSSVDGSIQCTSSYSSQHRLPRREARELVDQRLQRPPLLHLRGQRQRRIALPGRHPEQGGEQRHHLVRAGRSTRPSTASSLASCASGGSSRSSRAARSSRLDHRVERAVGVVRRAVVAERRMRLVAQALAQRPDHARLADPRLARQQHHLAVAILGPGPALAAGCRARARARPAA